MKFSIGDRILLKRTGEEGNVVAFISKTMMEVVVNGIQFPVHTDEVDHPYLKWFTEKKPSKPIQKPDIPVPEKSNERLRLAQGIYLSFLPQFASGTMDDEIDAFKIHLLNETPDSITYQYVVKDANAGQLFQHKAKLHPFGNVYLHSLSLEDLNAQPRIHWEVGASLKNLQNPLSGILKIRPAQLIRFIHEILKENQPSFSVLLTTDASAVIPQNAQAIKLSVSEPGSAIIRDTASKYYLNTTVQEVIDLHIEAIRKDEDYHSGEDLLVTQLAYLDRKLHAAISGGLPRMIIIHGLGKGRLKQRVHEVLAATKGIASYSNHWMGGYGWGATEVIFES